MIISDITAVNTDYRKGVVNRLQTVHTKGSRQALIYWLSTPHSQLSSSVLVGFPVPNRFTVT